MKAPKGVWYFFAKQRARIQSALRRLNPSQRDRAIQKSTRHLLKESYTWLGLLKKMFQSDFCVFDKQGNILASTLEEKKRHVLDLFSKTNEARHLLRQMESMEEAQNLGAWTDPNGQKKFLYRLV